MKNNLTYILIAAVALGVAVTGASAYTGRAVARRMSDQTARIGKLVPALHLEEKVEHGLFSTKREVKVELGCVPLPSQDGTNVERTAPIKVYWRDTIHHIPFLSGQGKGIARIDSELSIAAAGIEQLYGNRAPLSVRTLVATDGKFESDAYLAPFKAAPKAGDELEFSGLSMHVRGKFPEGAGKFSYTGNSQPFQVNAKAEDGDFAVNIGRMDLAGSVDMDPNAPSILMPYQNETKISEVSFRVSTRSEPGATPTNMNFSLQGVTGTAESKITKEHLWSNSNRVSGRLKTDSLEIDRFEMGSALRNLHAPTLDKLAQAWMRESFSCDQTQTLEQSMERLEGLAKSAAALLPYNPEYQVGPIAIELAGKRAELSYTVGMRGVAAGTPPPPIMELVFKHGYANAEAKLHLGLVDAFAAYAEKLSAGAAQPKHAAAPPGMPNPAALMARGMIDGFVQQGYLVRAGETVSGRVEFEGGAVKLNGKPFDLPDLGALGGPDMGSMMRMMGADEPADAKP